MNECCVCYIFHRGVEVGGLDQGYSVNVNRQGTWADSEAEKALKTILGFAKGCRGNVLCNLDGIILTFWHFANSLVKMIALYNKIFLFLQCFILVF